MEDALTDATPPATETDKPAKVQLTPNDWIAAATHILVDKSIDAVRVDVLAKQLNVTRGSFYWHFKDRGELLERVLQSWRDAATEQVIHRFDNSVEDPAQRLKGLLALPSRGRSATQSASIELAIRAWARRDEMARQAVDMVDTQRLSYIQRSFVQLGWPEAEAQTRAFALYSFMLGDALLRAQGNEAQREAWRQFVEATVLALR